MWVWIFYPNTVPSLGVPEAPGQTPWHVIQVDAGRNYEQLRWETSRLQLGCWVRADTSLIVIRHQLQFFVIQASFPTDRA